ncbi:hypothetical protein FHX44_115703 [Pseudonocardia hierapolitana]|uniref:Uncharacterized protein n=1 Tax=Pseudonocardia hierapolitana TaxID=1128676 RepID=A0A561SY28_9PSEU|nr:hypothetical protein FHX44_115703 [Pseudonocardia hierapolitana]
MLRRGRPPSPLPRVRGSDRGRHHSAGPPVGGSLCPVHGGLPGRRRTRVAAPCDRRVGASTAGSGRVRAALITARSAERAGGAARDETVSWARRSRLGPPGLTHRSWAVVVSIRFASHLTCAGWPGWVHYPPGLRGRPSPTWGHARSGTRPLRSGATQPAVVPFRPQQFPGAEGTTRPERDMSCSVRSCPVPHWSEDCRARRLGWSRRGLPGRVGDRGSAPQPVAWHPTATDSSRTGVPPAGDGRPRNPGGR